MPTNKFSFKTCAGYVGLLIISFFCGAGAEAGEQTPVSAQKAVPTNAQMCFVCHGPGGMGSLENAPRLAGRPAEYLEHALTMFKSGTRASPIMQTVAQQLTEQDIQNLSIYFSQQRPTRLPRPVAEGTLIEAGRVLAESGAGPVPACFSCHGPGGKGVGTRFPSIAGESPEFLVSRLHQFQERAKTIPIVAGSMTAVASQMSNTEIEQAAAYLSQIDP
ncbi:cytochrome c [Undibacterium terreum]|uniref:Cytochrome c n=2 Tax=Undibacterium terreum TaxID=1224302 RepID=A0A916U2Q9_9BURK|nr:cytochrome c [Undibacterium terreum]